jgi:hypothetical protein
VSCPEETGIFWEIEMSMSIDGPGLVALAAVGGSLIGGLSSVAAALIGQRVQARWQRLGAELDERETLYGVFVEEAARLFIDSIQQSSIDPAKIMRLYSKVARIRLISSTQVLRAAEDIARKVLETSEKLPENPVAVLTRYATGADNPDPLREFTEACRKERALLVNRYGMVSME